MKVRSKKQEICLEIEKHESKKQETRDMSGDREASSQN